MDERKKNAKQNKAFMYKNCRYVCFTELKILFSSVAQTRDNSFNKDTESAGCFQKEFNSLKNAKQSSTG